MRKNKKVVVSAAAVTMSVLLGACGGSTSSQATSTEAASEAETESAESADSDQEAAEKFLKAVEALVNELDTPTLEQFGINKEEFFNVIDKMAHDAMDSGSPQNTMRDVTEEEVKEIYRKLW